METQEDRVFGRPELFPPPPLPAGPSTSYDLCGVTVEGAEVVYARQGTAARPPLVFVHGWAASHRFWKYTLGAFAPRYCCIAPDLVGFGISEKPHRDYSVEALARWLGRFLDALGLRRVTLVGHSMGGTLALLFALDHPDRVERLAVVNPVVQGPTAFNSRTLLLTLPVVRRLAWWVGHVGWVRRWITRDFSFVQGLEEDLSRDVMAGTYESMMKPLFSLRKIDLAPRLGELRVPTLAVGTDEDKIVAPWQYEAVPAARKVRIAHSGHIPMVERPEEFNRALDAFLRGE